MRPGAVHVISEGSNWWFDETRKEYLRLPKEERPRERPEWGNAEAGFLQDAVWHPYIEWRIDRSYRLLITVGGNYYVKAPRAHLAGEPEPPTLMEQVLMAEFEDHLDMRQIAKDLVRRRREESDPLDTDL